MPVKSAGKPARLSSKQKARLDLMTEDEIEIAALSDADAQPWSDDELSRAKQARGGESRLPGSGSA